MRAVEQRGLLLYKQGKLPGSFYDGFGQEAISVGATFALGPGDPVSSPLIRDLGAHLVKGTDLTQIFRHYMGRENDLNHGREGNVHFGDARRGVVGMVSMLPDMMVVAAGIAMSFKMQGEPRCALSFFGDGATSRGDFHEAMNWAGLQGLPAIFILENNQLAYSTPVERQAAVDPVERAAGYGIESETIDGNDVEAVFEATHRARERALSGDGPTLIEAVTMRMHGHGAHDDMSYVPTALVEEWQRRDPIDRQRDRVVGLGAGVEDIEAEVASLVEEAVEAALAAEMPDPATAATGVFYDGSRGEITLGDGDAPWSGFATRPAPSTSAA
jgi:pyruvate dehydrogenase E1 component alpha subunit